MLNEIVYFAYVFSCAYLSLDLDSIPFQLHLALQQYLKLTECTWLKLMSVLQRKMPEGFSVSSIYLHLHTLEMLQAQMRRGLCVTLWQGTL